MQKNANRGISIIPHKTKIQLNQRPQHKTRYSKDIRKSLELIDTGDNFLTRALIAQALRLTVNKWGILKLKTSIRPKTLSKGQNGNLQNGKDLYQTCIQQMADTQNL